MPISVTTGDPVARAQTAAQLKYGSQEDAVKRAIANLATTRAADEASINTYGTEGRNAINQTFDQLAGNLSTNRQLNNANLGIQAAQIGQGYRDASQIGQTAANQAVGQLQSLAGNNANYGTMNLADYANPIVSLAAQQVANNANSDAAVTGNLKNWAAQQDSIMRAGESGAQRDRSNRLSGFETELLKSLATAKNQATGKEGDLQSQLLALIGERGTYTADSAANFADTAFGQQLQAAGFNLEESKAIQQAQQAQAQLAMQADELAFKRAASQAESRRQDAALAAQQAAGGKDDKYKELDYQLKLKALQQDAGKYTDSVNQQAFQNKLGLASFLNRAMNEGEASYNQAVDFLTQQGLLPSKQAADQIVAANNTVTSAPANSGVRPPGYGSKVVTPKAIAPGGSTGKAPLFSGNMGSWTGMR